MITKRVIKEVLAKANEYLDSDQKFFEKHKKHIYRKDFIKFCHYVIELGLSVDHMEHLLISSHADPLDFNITCNVSSSGRLLNFPVGDC